MTRWATIVLLTPLLALAAVAQDQPPPDDGQRPDQPRQRTARRGDRGGRGEWGPRMLERMAERLELDEAQRAEFDRIAAAQQTQMAALQEKRAAIREAREAGDQETADRLRAELEASGGFQTLMDDAVAELEPTLRDDQLAKLDEMRDEWRQRGGGGREEMQRVIAELPDALQLDEAQKGQFDELLETRRAEMRERFGEMRPLFEEMRAAREAGDDAKADELMQQIESKRPNRDSMLNDFFAQVEPLLTEQQKPLLVTYRESLVTKNADTESADGLTLRGLVRATARLSLTHEQRDELKRIQREATAESRELGRNDKEGQALLAAQIKERIVAMLDQEQVAQFEENLQRGNRRNK